MGTVSLRENKSISRFFLISTVLLVILSIAPLPALAQDTSSIDTLRQMGKAFTQIAEKASPAVVWIKAERAVKQRYRTTPRHPFYEPFGPFEDDFFDFFFRRQFPHRRSPRPKQHQQAQASGFIISADGYILTNNHVIEDSDKITVKLTDEREFEAKIVGTDPESEIAVIKIDTNELSFLELADSDTLEVGEWVLAIGNPFGLSHTVTAGIVSAKGRRNIGLTAYEDFIQTDAAINPGNSGGPLLNLDGKAVGINTAIVSRSGGNMGIGLAIPINMAKGVYQQLVEGGTVIRGFLGVGFEELTPKLAGAFGLDKDTKGVVITGVVKDSAAEKAGLKHNDVIVEFDGEPIEKREAFRNKVAMLKPGTKVEIAVLRDGKRKTFEVELGERPRKGQVAAAQPEALEQLGLSVQNLTDDLAKRFGYEDMAGVIVTEVEPGSPADREGISGGMLIMEVNRKQVSNTKEFNKEIEKAKEGEAILLLVTDGRYTRFVVLELEK